MRLRGRRRWAHSAGSWSRSHSGLSSGTPSIRGLRYKSALTLADEPRRGDLDGRGNLSTLRLKEFCRYFLEVCIDQVNFMESLLQPSELLRRMKLYVDDEVSANRLSKPTFYAQTRTSATFCSSSCARPPAPPQSEYAPASWPASSCCSRWR